MAILDTRRWESLEGWSATAFLVAGVLFLVNVGILAILGGVADMLSLSRELGQVFVGAGWTAALIGLLGLYPGLADRSRWLARAGAACAAIGTVVFAAMAVVMFVFVTGIVNGDFATLVPIFLPGVFVGSVLGFVLFAAASLRAGVHSRAFGVLLLIPAVIVVTNILVGANGMGSLLSTIGIVVALVVVHSTIGYLLRTGGAHAGGERVASSSDPSTG